jgi:hypothetical protein
MLSQCVSGDAPSDILRFEGDTYHALKRGFIIYTWMFSQKILDSFPSQKVELKNLKSSLYTKDIYKECKTWLCVFVCMRLLLG